MANLIKVSKTRKELKKAQKINPPHGWKKCVWGFNDQLNNEFHEDKTIV